MPCCGRPVFATSPARWETVSMHTSFGNRSEEHTSELQSLRHLVCRLLLEKKNKHIDLNPHPTQPVLPSLFCCPLPAARSMAQSAGRGSIGLRGERTASGAGVFFFNDTATTEIYTLSLHDALPI